MRARLRGGEGAGGANRGPMRNRRRPLLQVSVPRVHAVLRVLCWALLSVGALMLAPAAWALAAGESGSWQPFAATALITAVVAGVPLRWLRHAPLGRHDAIVACSLAWVLATLIAAVPLNATTGCGYGGAWLEATSGLTTTGLTVYGVPEDLPRATLLWRAEMQLLGGLGILAFFLLVAFRGSATHRLLAAESHKHGAGRLTPGVYGTLVALWRIYGLLVAAAILLYLLLGMGPFDAVTHGFTAAATGGFTNYAANMGYYAQSGQPRAALIELATALVVLVSGINFLVLHRLRRGEWSALWDGLEMRWYWGLGLGALGLMTVESLVKGGGSLTALTSHLRCQSFAVVSGLSSAGFVTQPLGGSVSSPDGLTVWPAFYEAGRLALVLLMVVGGCAGSTAGGLKMVRVALLHRVVQREVRRLSSPPSAVTPLVVDGRLLEDEQALRVTSMLFVWLGVIALAGAVLALTTHLTAWEAATLASSALGNFGPHFLPQASLAALPPAAQGTLIATMLAGRLEVLPVLVLLAPAAWGRARRMSRPEGSET